MPGRSVSREGDAVRAWGGGQKGEGGARRWAGSQVRGVGITPKPGSSRKSRELSLRAWGGVETLVKPYLDNGWLETGEGAGPEPGGDPPVRGRDHAGGGGVGRGSFRARRRSSEGVGQGAGPGRGGGACTGRCAGPSGLRGCGARAAWAAAARARGAPG